MNFEELVELLADFGTKGMEQTGLPVFLLALGFSLASALFVGYLYRVFYATSAAGSQVQRGFPLLGISITSIFITIQFSLPLSLGLLGALSIVRFRTPIKEPEEIAFIMLVVATSLSCATFNVLFLAIILAAAVVALLIMRWARGRHRPPTHGMIVVTVPIEGGRDASGSLIRFLETELSDGGLDCVTEDDGGSTVSYRFTGLDTGRIEALTSSLRSLAGGTTCNIYFDRSGVP